MKLKKYFVDENFSIFSLFPEKKMSMYFEYREMSIIYVNVKFLIAVSYAINPQPWRLNFL